MALQSRFPAWAARSSGRMYDMADRRQHWENVYRGKAADQVGWFQPHAASSLRLIENNADKDAHIIDVGGGASVLVDGLLDAGYHNLTVLDLAESALATSRGRGGARAARRARAVGTVDRRGYHPRRIASGALRRLA